MSMTPDTQRRLGLALALVLIVGGVVYLEDPFGTTSEAPPAPEDLPAELEQYPAAPNFAGGTNWVQGDPVELEEKRGEVVLVDFWTYSCINCIRTFPHLRAWHDTYADHGLTIVGVHTPEFRFEREAANVQEAIDRYDLGWSVVQDNEYDIWGAYHNRFWPAKYLIDQYGRIRYTHFGEGHYEETEDMIRTLLEEAGYDDLPAKVEPIPETETGARNTGRTPELFAGAAQGMARVGIGNEEGYDPGETITYAHPGEPGEGLERDKLYLVGTWYNGPENVTALSDDARVLLWFKAGAANFVARADETQCVEVRINGTAIPADLAGSDVDLDGEEGTPCVPVDFAQSRDVYAGPFTRQLLELRVEPGFDLYSFAFSNQAKDTMPHEGEEGSE